MTDELQQRHDELVCEVASYRAENIKLRQMIEDLKANLIEGSFEEDYSARVHIKKLARERDLCMQFVKFYVDNVENP